MQEFVEYVVKGLVDQPDAVTVTEVESEGATVYELRMDSEDVAKVIGRRGVTINAIRSLLQAGAANHSAKQAELQKGTTQHKLRGQSSPL